MLQFSAKLASMLRRFICIFAVVFVILPQLQPVFGQVEAEWVSQHVLTNTWEMPTAMTLDASGNIYIAGMIGSGDRAHYLTLKYDPNGRTLWAAQYGRGRTGQGRPETLAIDRSGNVIVTGSFGTVKYDIDGNQVWARSQFAGTHLAADENGSSFVAVHPRLTKLTPDGDEVWSSEAEYPATLRLAPEG
ncbi:MAG: hypothetical protein L0Z50_22090 [Verrucomicrobiales bacterium]|nr:hypothetical protein [Verrucomicrobiales bacterium]